MKALALAAAFTAPLGSYISDLKVAPDGAAWVREDSARAIRVASDGRVRATELHAPALASAIGADGQLWLTDGDGGMQRVDAEGKVTTPREAGVADPEAGIALVAGPDGGLWTLTSADEPRLARFLPDGSYHESPLPLPPCEEPISGVHELVRASDGAVWGADLRCERLLRIAPTGEVAAIPVAKGVVSIAADAAGGVWFSAIGATGGHATATGAVTPLPAAPIGRDLEPWDVSVAPDGRPWFSTRRCTLLRVSETGTIERHKAPIPAEELAFDPTGRLWLASTTRVARADAPGACDERPPKVKLAGGDPRRGLRVTVDEPTSLAIVVTLLPGGDYRRARSGPDRLLTLRKRGSFRQPLPKRWKLERGDVLSVLLQARDRDGNAGSRTVNLKVRR